MRVARLDVGRRMVVGVDVGRRARGEGNVRWSGRRAARYLGTATVLAGLAVGGLQAPAATAGSRAVAGVPGPALDVAGRSGAAPVGSIRVTWMAPTDDGGSAPTGYLVTATPGGATCSWTAGPLTCDVAGLTVGTPYTFTVTTTTVDGTGEPSSASPPVTPTPFVDVPGTAPFGEHIGWLAAHGISTGVAGSTFRPAEALSRQALASLLFRYQRVMAGMAADDAHPTCGSSPFPDVPVDNPFCGEIEWLKGQFIIQGYADGTFRPTAPVTRQAVAAFLYRIRGNLAGVHPVCSPDAFVDVHDGTPFCGEIRWLFRHAIAQGYPGGLDPLFKPGTVVSRQAMAAFLHRLSADPSAVNAPFVVVKVPASGGGGPGTNVMTTVSRDGVPIVGVVVTYRFDVMFTGPPSGTQSFRVHCTTNASGQCTVPFASPYTDTNKIVVTPVSIDTTPPPDVLPPAQTVTFP